MVPPGRLAGLRECVPRGFIVVQLPVHIDSPQEFPGGDAARLICFLCLPRSVQPHLILCSAEGDQVVFPSRARQLQPIGPLLQPPAQTLIGRQRLVRIRPEPAHTLGPLLLFPSVSP